MLTANGKAICKINNTIVRNNTTLKGSDGESYTFLNSGSDSSKFVSLMSGMGIIVGSGTTEAKHSDIDLESEVTNLTTVTSFGTNTSENANFTQNYIGVFSKTFKNNTQDDIVVSEVGLRSAADFYQTPKKFLIARDVISPITIKPGEAYTFTMYIG